MIVKLLLGALMIGSIYGLIALGYSVIYKASGMMSFVQGNLFMAGSFLGLVFYSTFKLPYVVSVLLTMAVMFLFGFGMEKGIIRTLIKKKSPGIFIVLATIAVGLIIDNIITLLSEGSVYYFPSVFGKASVTLAGIKVQPESLLAVGVSVVFMVLFHLFMTKTKFGTAMRSAAQDPDAARSCGIDVSLTTGITWALASGIAALAGILYGPVYSVSITMGSLIGTKGFSSAIIGGYGNMYGAILGGFILGVIETLAAGYVSSVYKDFVAYGILLLFLFIRPTGIFNEKALEA